jgi:hypothetical protein
MIKIIFVAIAVLAIFAQAESYSSRFGFKRSKKHFLKKYKHRHRLGRRIRLGGNTATTGTSNQVGTAGNGRCFKHFAPDKTMQINMGSNHFTVPCQECSSATLVNVNSIQSNYAYSKLHMVCGGSNTNRLCDAWTASGCTFTNNVIACPAQCDCIDSLNTPQTYTHNDASNRGVRYTASCSASHGYRYSIERKHNGAWVPVSTNYLPYTTSVVGASSPGLAGGNNGGGSNNGGGVNVDRRRRLLQSQQSS